MIGALGQVGVLAALAGAILLVFEGLRGVDARPEGFRRGTRALVGGAVGAMLALELGLLSDDFSIAYIANNSATTTPLVFKVASAWAALEGSIVLWGLVLAGFTWLVHRSYAHRPDRLAEGALAVLGAVAVFFFGVMATIANPFEVCTQIAGASCVASSPWPWASAVAVADGLGPNPLLQNHLLMAVHPPMLYIGYVGLTVPYAYAMSALVLRQPGIEWARRTKHWTLITWTFLTLGILLGAWWSYEVLGWGGYWAWDPVENASLLPWLAATAFIHSSFVQMRRGMLQAWNFVLVISAFSLTILGTFLTRSGTIASVHSFTQSAIGPALLAFLAVVLVASFAVFALRADHVAQSPRLESLFSREGAFLANNLLLTVIAFVVLAGTLFPLFVEAFGDQTVGISRPFFDRFTVPLGLTLILAMGVGPLMPYRVARPAVVWERLRSPVRWGLAAGAAAVLGGLREAWPIITITLAGFVASAIVRHLIVSARKTVGSRHDRLGPAIVGVLRSDHGFWGGQIAHLGVLILAVGIATTGGLSATTTVLLERGESASLAGYDFTYRAGFSRQEPNRDVLGARIEVQREGDFVAIVEPRANVYATQRVPTPGVLSRPSGDLYFTIIRIGGDAVTMDVWWFPYQWMVWLGGLVVVLGGAWSTVMRAATRERVHA